MGNEGSLLFELGPGSSGKSTSFTKIAVLLTKTDFQPISVPWNRPKNCFQQIPRTQFLQVLGFARSMTPGINAWMEEASILAWRHQCLRSPFQFHPQHEHQPTAKKKALHDQPPTTYQQHHNKEPSTRNKQARQLSQYPSPVIANSCGNIRHHGLA